MDELQRRVRRRVHAINVHFVGAAATTTALTLSAWGVYLLGVALVTNPATAALTAGAGVTAVVALLTQGWRRARARQRAAVSIWQERRPCAELTHYARTLTGADLDVRVVDADHVNAFTGRHGPVTWALVSTACLDDSLLDGVLAHEAAHAQGIDHASATLASAPLEAVHPQSIPEWVLLGLALIAGAGPVLAGAAAMALGWRWARELRADLLGAATLGDPDPVRRAVLATDAAPKGAAHPPRAFRLAALDALPRMPGPDRRPLSAE